MITHGNRDDRNNGESEYLPTRWYVWTCEVSRRNARPWGKAQKPGCGTVNLTSSIREAGHPNLQPWCSNKECRRRARLNPRTRLFYEFTNPMDARRHLEYLEAQRDAPEALDEAELLRLAEIPAEDFYASLADDEGIDGGNLQ